MNGACRTEIATRGFALRRAVLSKRRLSSLLRECGDQGLDRTRIGARDLLTRLPGLRRLLRSKTVRDLVEPVLGATAFPVRGLYFDKSPRANWAVLWHQDLTVAVKRKVPVPDYGPWSKKAGIDHVQPPVAVLEEMLALRFHLDPARAETGALMVLPGSHRLGRLDSAETGRRAETKEAHLCEAAAGDVLVMRPLLLHASRKAARPRRRRVIHVEFAANPLAPPLEWYERAASETRS
jgi:hypothetical protein